MHKLIPAFCAALMLAAAQTAFALPQMDITQAKATLTNRDTNPTGNEFKLRRITDRPSFDKLGIGNYFTEYRLDAGQRIQVWMYVESAPPIVDEVVVYIYPAQAKDLTFERALKLLNIVYADSRTGNKVVADFKAARAPFKNQYNQTSLTYQQGSLLPLSHDGSLYYMGKAFGYKVGLDKGGLQVDILRKDFLQKYILDIKKRRFPDPKPTPKPTPTPGPGPTPHPKIVW